MMVVIIAHFVVYIIHFLILVLSYNSSPDSLHALVQRLSHFVKLSLNHLFCSCSS